MKLTWISWLGICVVLCLLFVMFTRTVMTSKGQLARCQQANVAQRSDDVNRYCGEAIRWYFPGSSYVVAALEILEKQASREGQEQNYKAQVRTLRTARGSLLEQRSFFTPYANRVSRIEVMLAQALAEEPPAPMHHKLSKVQRVRVHLKLLRARTAPQPIWGFAALCGLGVWLFSTFKLLGSFEGRGNILVTVARKKWGLSAVLGLGLFCLGLWLA